jgi:CubicO group peptidase (beta-lactamase class C family)
LTKLYTLATALSVLREAQIPLETPLLRFFPNFTPEITLERLMSHRSGIGFPIQRLEAVAATDWLTCIAAAPFHSAPGTIVLYSCTNYFLLARAIEQISGASLEALMSERIFKPLQLEQTVFEPTTSQQVAPTERHDDGIWQGIVHDEAARSWRHQTGCCAGNAGLFATAADVAHFAKIWVQKGAGILHSDDVTRVFATRYPENSTWRGLGFQFDIASYMSEAAPNGSAGHLGFTGPSLILHPPTAQVAVILNNRVHPTRTGPDRLPYHKRIAAFLFSGC